MTGSRNFVATPVHFASAAPLGAALAQATKEPAGEVDFLFVQNAKSMTFDKANGASLACIEWRGR